MHPAQFVFYSQLLKFLLYTAYPTLYSQDNTRLILWDKLVMEYRIYPPFTYIAILLPWLGVFIFSCAFLELQDKDHIQYGLLFVPNHHFTVIAKLPFHFSKWPCVRMGKQNISRISIFNGPNIAQEAGELVQIIDVNIAYKMSLFFLWMILLHSFHMSITAKPTELEIILFFQSISVVFFIVLYYYMFFPLEVSLSKFRRLTSIKPKSSVRF